MVYMYSNIGVILGFREKCVAVVAVVSPLHFEREKDGIEWHTKE